MMRLSHFIRPNRRPLLILAAIVLAVAGLAAGGWWYNASRATADYRSRVTSYVSNAAKELDKIRDTFKALSAGGDTKASIDTLDSLSTTLTKQASGLPALPELFGITLTAPADAQKRGELIQRLTQLSNDAKAARDLLRYQQSATAVLQEAVTKTGPNADQQKALAATWASMTDKLKQLTPPAEAASTHQQLINGVAAVQASLAALPDLFTKKDVAGFAAKQKEMETHVGELRAIGDSIAVQGITHDRAIARDYARLKELLK